jgi:hypothetical protein
MSIRPFIKEAVISKLFIKDLEDEEEAELMIAHATATVKNA